MMVMEATITMLTSMRMNLMTDGDISHDESDDWLIDDDDDGDDDDDDDDDDNSERLARPISDGPKALTKTMLHGANS